MTIKLTEEQEAWLHELETTDKKRGQELLFNAKQDGYCCLGIYAQMQVDKGLAERREYVCGSGDIKVDFWMDGEDESEILPESLTEKLGLNSPEGDIRDEYGESVILNFMGNGRCYPSIASLNDGLSLEEYPTFKEIAAFIRENAQYIFKQEE